MTQSAVFPRAKPAPAGRVRGSVHGMFAAQLRTQIFADGADLDGILRYRDDPLIKGFTTNPTLMRAAGVDRLRGVRARGDRASIRDRPISFEVFSDDFDIDARRRR